MIPTHHPSSAASYWYVSSRSRPVFVCTQTMVIDTSTRTCSPAMNSMMMPKDSCRSPFHVSMFHPHFDSTNCHRSDSSSHCFRWDHLRPKYRCDSRRVKYAPAFVWIAPTHANPISSASNNVWFAHLAPTMTNAANQLNANLDLLLASMDAGRSLEWPSQSDLEYDKAVDSMPSSSRFHHLFIEIHTKKIGKMHNH